MLNLQQLRVALKTLTFENTSVPVTYYQFAEGETVSFPCIAYYEEGTDNFGADNVVYKKVRNVTVDLYSELRLLDLEADLEKLFTDNKIFYDSVSSYIESEKLYLTRYGITLI